MSSETLPCLIQKHNTVLNLVVLFTYATLQITHFVTFLELTLINTHHYNWKYSDKLVSICLYFLQIQATKPNKSRTCRTTRKEHRDRYYTAALKSYTHKCLKKCLSHELYQMHLKLLGFWTLSLANIK